MRTPRRYAACAVILLLLITSVVVCVHTVTLHHDKHCGLCATARLSSVVPTTAPVLTALDVSPDAIPTRPIPMAPKPATRVSSSRAPPSPTE